MDARAIYRKSDKGTEAIAARSPAVGGKLRMLLILVDGKKNVDELNRLAAGLGESDQLLLQLEAGGLIELAVAAPAGAAARSPQAGAGGDTGTGADLGKVKALATRLLIEQLGPMADEVCIKLEGARDIPQFVEAMKRAYGMVREVRGADAASRFGQEVEAQMPPG